MRLRSQEPLVGFAADFLPDAFSFFSRLHGLFLNSGLYFRLFQPFRGRRAFAHFRHAVDVAGEPLTLQRIEMPHRMFCFGMYQGLVLLKMWIEMSRAINEYGSLRGTEA